MRPSLMTILRLIARLDELEGKSWPDHPTVSRLRVLFSKAATRLIVGAVAGLGIGTFSAILGLRLSGVDVGDASTFNQMVKLVVLFALVWAVILACLFDFAHLYVRFLQYGQTRRARKVSGKGRKMWDDEIDGPPTAPSSTRKPERPDHME
jgi:hypothetical protein